MWVGDLNGGAAGIGSQGRSYQPRDDLSQRRHRKTRSHGVMPHKRMKQYDDSSLETAVLLKMGDFITPSVFQFFKKETAVEM